MVPDAPSNPSASPRPEDLPDLFCGGLLHGLMHRFGVDPADALRTARRAVLLALCLWIPEALLALFEGHLVPGSVRLPFLFDVAAHVRPLLVVPLFVVARPIHTAAWRRAGLLLTERGIVGPTIRPAFDALVERLRRRTQSPLPDLVCLALAGVLTWALFGLVRSAPRSTWFAVTEASGATRITLAGWWSGAVVHTLVFALTLRWLWIYAVWYGFLFGVSRLSLTLHPAHPDRAAGLALLGPALGAAAPVIAAWSLGTAAGAANEMLFHGTPILALAPVGIALLVAVLLVYVVPLVVIFLPLLVRTRREALEALGRHMAFEGDRLCEPKPEVAEARASLEELQVAVEAVRDMLPIPFWPTHLVPLLLAAAVPAFPLLLLAFPFGHLVRQVLDLVV